MIVTRERSEVIVFVYFFREFCTQDHFQLNVKHELNWIIFKLTILNSKKEQNGYSYR